MMMVNYPHCSYESFQKFEFKIGETYFYYFSKPGLESWNQLSPTDKLITSNLALNKSDKVLLLGCGNGVSCAWIANQVSAGEIWFTDLNFIALTCTEKTLHANKILNAKVINPIDLENIDGQLFDVIVIVVPKGRKIVRRWLLDAFTLLKPGQFLYLVGANRQGILSLIKDAEDLFSTSKIINYRKGNRIVEFRKNSQIKNLPNWSREPGISPGSWYNLSVKINEVETFFYSLPGVFSYNHIDEGTAFLLDNIETRQTDSILDIGCGYGILGIAAIIKTHCSTGNVKLDLVDNNMLAVACTERNLAVNHIQNARVIASDLLSGVRDESYQLILANPPFHSGMEVDYSITRALISQSYSSLKPKGQLMIVANRFIRYDRILNEYFPQVSIKASNKRYHIFIATKGK